MCSNLLPKNHGQMTWSHQELLGKKEATLIAVKELSRLLKLTFFPSNLTLSQIDFLSLKIYLKTLSVKSTNLINSLQSRSGTNLPVKDVKRAINRLTTSRARWRFVWARTVRAQPSTLWKFYSETEESLRINLDLVALWIRTSEAIRSERFRNSVPGTHRLLVPSPNRRIQS